MHHLKIHREVLNQEAEEGEESFMNMFTSVSFYIKCAARLTHPWPWLVGMAIETNIVEKHVQLVYQANDTLHVFHLLYATLSLVRLVDISEWGRHSKVRIA